MDLDRGHVWTILERSCHTPMNLILLCHMKEYHLCMFHEGFHFSGHLRIWITSLLAFGLGKGTGPTSLLRQSSGAVHVLLKDTYLGLDMGSMYLDPTSSTLESGTCPIKTGTSYLFFTVLGGSMGRQIVQSHGVFGHWNA